MSQRRIPIMIVVVVAVILILLLCAGLVYGGSILFASPLGPTLSIPTSMPTNIIFPTQGVPQTVPILPTTMPPALPTPTTQPVTCGQSGTMTILVLGIDAPFSNVPRGPLAIRMARVDFVQKSASVFAFPRDLRVYTTGLEGFGISQTRLGQVYLFARNLAGYDDYAATNLVAQNLYRNFGAVADHYVTIRLTNLALIIDTVGGIDVSIPVTYDGTPYGLHYFPAGVYHMNGALALEYAMAPSSYQLWSGFARQNQIIQALRQKILSPALLSGIPALVQQFFAATITDLSMQQMLDLACISQQIPSDRIVWAGVDSYDVTVGAGGELIPKGDAIRIKVQQYLGQ